MRGKGYRFAVKWIANEDEPTEFDVDVVAGTLTVALVADMFGKEQADVAEAVVDQRWRRETKT